MVLGLLDFLLGGKKKTKVSKSAQVSNPMNSVGGNTSDGNKQGPQVPDGQQTPTQNSTENKTPEEQSSQNAPQTTQQSSSGVKKSSVSEALMKIHKELKETNERVTTVVSDVKKIETTVNSLGHRVDELDEHKKETEEKISDIDANMSKFLSLYELVNNQYNPFVDQEKQTQQEVKQVVLADGSSQDENLEDASNDAQAELAKKLGGFDEKSSKSGSNDSDSLESSLIELDTLDIEEAAADAVPLTRLKNNTNSLVIILSWLEYLINRVGIDETRNTLRYYTEVLRWTTPEVYFDLDKYLRGMKDKKELEGDESLNVRDHIVSLYFISKLNEKALDQKLTRAVLQIIKQ